MTHVDPVCGMTIEEADAVGTLQHNGVTYYFCNPSCLERFKADPKTFLTPVATSAVPPPAGASYICPMDPEVHSSTPGACPKCGMALEPDLSKPAALTKIAFAENPFGPATVMSLLSNVVVSTVLVASAYAIVKSSVELPTVGV